MAVKLRNGRWYVDYFPEGRYGPRKMLSLPEGISEEEAKGLDKQIRDAAVRARSGKQKIARPSNLTVKALFEKYLVWYKLHRSPKTYNDINSVLKCHINPTLGRETAESIGPDHVLLYKTTRKHQKGSNVSINKELAYFSGFMKWAAKKGNEYISPRELKMEKLPYKRPIPIVLSFDEVIKILNAAEPKYQAFFLCLYSLGLRLKEARLLTWDHVDFENDSIMVQQKGGGYKQLPMGEALKTLLKNLPRYENVPYVFWNPERKAPLYDPRKAIARAVKKAGIKKRVTPHLFRHSWATHLLAKGTNLRVIQKLLGHAQLSTTEIYTHVDLEVLREAASAIKIEVSTQNAENTG